jgi:hypothetical protein
MTQPTKTAREIVFEKYLNSQQIPYGGKHGDRQDAPRCTNLRINPRRLMPQLLNVLNVRPRINSGMAVRAALTAQFQHT